MDSSGKRPRGSIILMCGLPGCGKSFTTREIKSNLYMYIQKYPIISTIVICDLSYDDYLSASIIENDEWKKLRKIFQMAVEVYIQKIFQLPLKTTEELVDTLKKLQKNFPTDIDESKNYIFLLDDNFYYSSMRHEWYQVSRKYGLGFGQVFLKCDVSLAISRNSQRSESERVLEEVIQRMNDRAEWPDPKCDKYYCHTVILDGDKLIETDLFSVINLIITTLNDPVQPLEDKNEKKLYKIEETKNLIHQSDIILRKLVSQVIKKKMEKTENVDVKSLVAKMIHIRHNILSKIQNNELTFSDLMGEDLNISILSEKLKILFWNEVNLIIPGSSA